MLSYLLITLIIFFGHSEDLLGTTLLSRPLVLAPLVGWALGDWQQGVVIGASLELIFMGNIKVGAAIPPDVVTGGVLGTAFAMLSHKGVGIALALAIPISILAEMLLSALFVTRSVFNKTFVRYAAEGNWRGVQRLHVLSGFVKPVLMALVGFLALRLGAGVMKNFLDTIPSWVNTGLQVAGNLLPALGFALLMNLLFHKRVAPYFFLGFLLAAYLKMPVIAIGGLGVIIAFLVTQDRAPSAPDEDSEEEEADRAPAGANDLAPPQPALAKRDLRRIFWRSMLLEANFNFETWQNTGFAFALLPVLKKFYSTKESMAAALQRHLQLFNTSTYGSTLILGLTAAMEEQNSRDAEFDAESINSVKLGLMGPLAGVFDSLFWGTLKVIAAGVGTSLALKGNVMGVVLFILLFNVPHLLLRYQLTFIGYKTGTRFLMQLSKNNVMDRLKNGAAILGLMVVGAMPATLMSIHTPLSFGEGAGLQGVLDQIVPALLPLGLTFLTYYFLRRGVKTTALLLGLLVVGFLGSILHWII
ncbi:MAG TPA: PTS system mannose/fructose/sorbose family transporter subunit IID [Puia sp.]|uniref:PTS system mannose/fructose/sorbose family transporter subunit IID n=1 Tax=Puia sp. TaxID=2045100 RepID=UPI002C96691E|nr:PTS system mannose/fructose/sorbose family transporter subunit IID [Puia sp.]HVU99467.1 PTS system mannose/fructose/sorbose family transporter subunit IID [Puia sp.]